jgi:hypothetical protein
MRHMFWWDASFHKTEVPRRWLFLNNATVTPAKEQFGSVPMDPYVTEKRIVGMSTYYVITLGYDRRQVSPKVKVD